MSRNGMLKIKQVEGLREILTGSAVSAPTDEILIGAGLDEPIISRTELRYNITDGLRIGSGGIIVDDFAGGGDRMVVVDDDGIFSVQAIPDPSLPATYVGVGDVDGLLSGTADLTYDITNGLIIATGGLTISSLGGGGNLMVVVDDDGVFSAQEIPATAELQHTYIGVGGSDGIMTGDDDLTWDGSRFVIGAGVEPGFTDGILTIKGNGSTVRFVMDNPTSTGLSQHVISEDAVKYATLTRHNNNVSTNVTGTSIPQANMFSITNHFFGEALAPIAFKGLAVYNLAGATSTNFGTKVDVTGFRIGQLSTLHNANTYGFEASVTNAKFGTGNGSAFSNVFSDDRNNHGFVTFRSGTDDIYSAFGISDGSTWFFRINKDGQLNSAYSGTNYITGNIHAGTGTATVSGKITSIGTVAANDVASTSENLSATGYASHHLIAGSTNGQIRAFGQSYSGNFSGSSIGAAGFLSVQSGLGSNPLHNLGSYITNFAGTSATNYGSRLDSSGLRIGAISGLHTGNTVPFEITFTTNNMKFTQSGAASQITTSQGLDLIASTNDLTLNASSGNIYMYKPVRFGSTATAPTARLDIMENTTALASLRLRPSSSVNVTSPNDGEAWYDGQYVKWKLVSGLRMGSTPGSGVEGLFGTNFLQFNNATYTFGLYARTGSGSFGNYFGDGQLELFATVPSGMILGTTGTKPIALATDNTVRVIVDSAGAITATSLLGTGDRIVEADSTGKLSATREQYSTWITDATIIADITETANWSEVGVYIGPALTGAYQGQMYVDARYKFEMIADNSPIRLARV